MKIPKIIGIMKSFTSVPLNVQTGDNPALRVIIPTLWGASPHGLGKRVRAARVGGALIGPDAASETLLPDKTTLRLFPPSPASLAGCYASNKAVKPALLSGQ
jgi:hypothetical protein